MLNGTLRLHDIDDVEIFCVRLIHSQRPGGYRGHDYEDLLSYLIEEVWRLSLRFEPERGSLRNFVIRRQPIRNWERKHFGRTVWRFGPSAGRPDGHVYERARPTFVPLDDRPDLPDPGWEADLAGGGLQDLLGLHGTGGGSDLGADGEGDQGEDGLAA